MLGSEIRELVIVKMEEHTPFGDKSGETLLAGGDIIGEVKPVYSYIDATLQEAANEALMVIPIEHLTPIVIDPVHIEHAGEQYICVGDNEKRYYQTSEDDGDISNGVTCGIRKLYPYIIWKMLFEDVALFRYPEEDINSDETYYCWRSANNELYYTESMAPASGANILDSNLNIAGRVFSFNVSRDVITDDGPLNNDVAGEWYRGWISDDGIKVYTSSGNSLPPVNVSNVYHLVSGALFSIGYVSQNGQNPPAINAVPDADDMVIGTILKPAGYLRLHTLQMGSWTRPVHTVVRPDNPLYIQQFDKWARGHYCKPVVTDDGKRLHYYSQSASATAGEIKNFLYVPEFDLDTDYPKNVAEVIAIHTAGKIYEIFSQTEQMGIMAKEMESVISTMKL